MNIDRLDHFVLTVRDLEATCEFYASVLGMKVATFGNNRTALKFGNQKINLHQAGKEFEPKAFNPTPGSGDFCFITEIPLQQVVDRIKSLGIEIIEGPVKRTGAVGPIASIYLRDPDGNLVEISNYINS